MKGGAMSQAVSRRPFTAEAQVRSRFVHMGFVVDKVALGQVFLQVLQFSPVKFIPPVLHENGKVEKSSSSSSQGCTLSLKAAVRP
jgi:hypothetical protein